MKYRILLICRYFSLGTTALFVLKNLQQLGHNVFLWDTEIMSSPPEGDYDIALTWTNNIFDFSLVRAKKKVLYYLEDSDYYGQTSSSLGNGKKIEEWLPFVDNYFTMNRLPGHESHWLPMGGDEEIHRTLNDFPNDNAVLFVGTARDDNRINFARLLQEELQKNNIPLYLMGNGWNESALSMGVRYFDNFNLIVNQFKIVVNLHMGKESPSDKVHCITACGKALLINDNKEAYRECYPMAPVWDTVPELVEKILYYLQHDTERINLVKEMQSRCHQDYCYRRQLERLIKTVMG